MENSEKIKIEGLSKRFPVGGGYFTALENINISVGKGEFVGLVGPSGSGKTTLLNIVGTLDTPSTGKAFVLGQPVSNLSHKAAAQLRKKYLGFIFQTYNLLPVYTAYRKCRISAIVAGYDSQ